MKRSAICLTAMVTVLSASTCGAERTRPVTGVDLFVDLKDCESDALR
jgi:hypothetical protein